MSNFKSWEQIGRDSRKKMRSINARFASVCPQCRQPIAIGAEIIQPYVRHREGGNQFSNCWYCAECGELFQRGVDCGAFACGPFISVADIDAFNDRPDVKAWRAAASERWDGVNRGAA